MDLRPAISVRHKSQSVQSAVGDAVPATRMGVAVSTRQRSRSLTLEASEFRRFVSISHNYGQLRVETCTLANHLEALRVSERIEKALRAAIPEGLWPCLALEISQDRSLAENVDAP